MSTAAQITIERSMQGKCAFYVWLAYYEGYLIGNGVADDRKSAIRIGTAAILRFMDS